MHLTLQKPLLSLNQDLSSAAVFAGSNVLSPKDVWTHSKRPLVTKHLTLQKPLLSLNLDLSSAAVFAGSNAYIIGGWRNQTNFPTNSIIKVVLDSLETTVL